MHRVQELLTGAAFLIIVELCRGQFPPPDAFNPAAVGEPFPQRGGNYSSCVSAVALQTDGTIMVAGDFSTLTGLESSNLGRLSCDGGIAFTSSANCHVTCLLVQPDGKTVVGGSFNQLAGGNCANLGRLNADGSLDLSFNPQINGYVNYLAAQPDGGFLVAGDLGSFTEVAGHAANHLVRLGADGALNTWFKPGHGAVISQICCLAVQNDGKVLVAGEPAAAYTPTVTNLVRLNADGSLDPSFQPVVTASGSYPSINCLALQADGRILVGGYFSSLCGYAHANLGRLNCDGSLDSSFTGATDGSVQTIAVQSDGMILLGGYFTGFLHRLNPADGSEDTGFNPQITFVPPNPSFYLEPNVDCLQVQPDGKVLFGGVFSAVDGATRVCIARLTGPESIPDNLTIDGSTITWQRSGGGPEVTSAQFDQFADGTWLRIGEGLRVIGGWQLTNAVLLPGATLRARGLVAGQCSAGSSCWYVENMTGLAPLKLSITVSNGLPALNVSGELGRRYTIEYSSVLDVPSAWNPLATLWLTNNPETFFDSSACGQTQRYYRATLTQISPAEFHP